MESGERTVQREHKGHALWHRYESAKPYWRWVRLDTYGSEGSARVALSMATLEGEYIVSPHREPPAPDATPHRVVTRKPVARAKRQAGQSRFMPKLGTKHERANDTEPE